MDIASYEERSDPESFKKTIPLFEDRGPELRTIK
jgi:hypothetical protein